MPETYETREAWLLAAAELLAPIIEDVAGAEMPPLRISVGFPGGTSNRKTTIGQCWPTSATGDGVNQIFMSPIRGEADTVNVLGTLLHEMIHAIDDCESGHRGNFARIAKGVGFIPKLTSSDNRSEELTSDLTRYAEALGPFPHPALQSGVRGSEEPKKQSSRMLKLQCPDDGYIVRTSQKWIDEGLPSCHCGGEFEVV